MSVRKRRKIIHAFGGETIIIPAEESLEGCLQQMRVITEAEPKRTFVVNHFANPRTLRSIPADWPEIWQDKNGEIDFFVAGIGSAVPSRDGKLTERTRR